MEDEDLKVLLGWGRVFFGLLAVLAPNRTAALWTGSSDDGAFALAMRGLGIRDVALGAGLLIANESDAPTHGWLEAGALADSVDAFSTLTGHGIPWGRRILVAASALGAAALGIYLAGEEE